MAQIGDTDEEIVKVYVVNKADDPPTADTKFTDYSDYFIEWTTKGEINKLSQFEGTAVSIDSTTKRGEELVVTAATIDKGNLIYAMSGTKLIGKYVIQKVIFNTDFTVKVSGIQSTGTEKLNRKIANESTPTRAYTDISFNTILTSTSSDCQGLLVDGAENTILSSTVSSGADDVYSVNFDNQNRMSAVDKLVNVAGKEWWVNHGTNDTTPYDNGDTLYVDDREGTSVSSKTFYFTGTNTNAQLFDGGDEVETNANHVIMEGQNQTNVQIKTEAADFSGQYSYITEGLGLDGWLKEDIEYNGATIPLTDDSFKSLQCCSWSVCNVIRIDNERIITSDLTYPLGIPTLSVYSRASGDSEASPHKAGADIVFLNPLENVEGELTARPVRIYVDDVSCFCTLNSVTEVVSHLITIGDEVIGYKNSPEDGCYYTPGEDYILAWRSWTNSYAHGDKTIVREGGSGWNSPAYIYDDTWSPANPDNQLNFNTLAAYFADETITGNTSGSTAKVVSGNLTYNELCVSDISGDFCCGESINGSVTGSMGTICMDYHTNSIQQNGLYSKTLSDNNATTKHMIDLKAQQILQTKRLPIKRISVKVIDTVGCWNSVDIGDTITLADGSYIGFTDGEEIRVTGWEYKFGGASTSLVFICNDKETRSYASGSSPNYVNEKVTSEEPKMQEALRTYNKVFGSSECAGNNASWSEGLKQLTDVMGPVDNFDAANKKYVDDATTGAGIWACNDTSCYLIPATPRATYTICVSTVDTGYLSVRTYVTSDLIPSCHGSEGEPSGWDLGASYKYWDHGYIYALDTGTLCTWAVMSSVIYTDDLYVNGCPVTAGGCWENTTGGIRPIAASGLYPLYSYYTNLGCSGLRWDASYFCCGDFLHRLKLPVGTNMY